MIGPSLTSFAQQTDRAIEDMGVLLLLLPSGFLSGIYIFRYVSSYKYSHWFVVAAVIFYAVTIINISFITSFYLLIAVCLALAICQGLLDMLCNMMLIRLYRKNSVPYMNVLHFLFGVGAILSPVLIGLGVQYFDHIRYPYLLFALLSLPALLILCFVRIQPALEEEEGPTPQVKKLRILPFIHIFFLFYLVIEVGYSSWIYPYVNESGLLNAAAAGLFTSGFWLAFTFFRLVAVLLSVYFHPLNIMLGHSVICLLAACLMTLFSHNLIILWFGNIALGAGISVFFACMLAYSGSYLQVRPRDISHFFTSATVGAMAGPWLLAQLYAMDKSWIFYPLVFAAAAIFIALIYVKGADDKIEKEVVSS